MASVHDLSDRVWGCNYNIMESIDRGMKLDLIGWHRGIKDGDYLILKNGSDTTRYVVESVNYFSDPSDMWSASVLFAPRE
tara:strand:- start:1980 stop:2219 length:240 start_codon:yes stop_codon:yes gene_type:complete